MLSHLATSRLRHALLAGTPVQVTRDCDTVLLAVPPECGERSEPTCGAAQVWMALDEREEAIMAIPGREVLRSVEQHVLGR